jgi:MFS family permease
MKYYQKLTLLFCLMWGFLGVQRVIISVIMPDIKKGLNLTNFEAGLVVAVTALVWAFSTILWAALGDRYGRRPIIALCTILSAIFSWTTGLVASFVGMLTVRGFLGFLEGGPSAPAMGTITEESPEHRRALNAGLVTGSFMLIGVCFGSQVATWISGKYGWQHVFYYISLPGLLIGIILLFVMREAPSVAEGIRMRKSGQAIDKKKADQVKVRDALKYKNVLLSSINSIPVMGWLYVYTTFSSIYLVEVHHFPMWPDGGLIISASGLGGFLGEFIMGHISDIIGRKKALIVSAFLCSAFGVLVALMPVGTSPLTFGLFFFFYGLFGAGMYPMYLGTLPAEAVPPRIAGTAVAIPVAIGETLGAALGPAVSGMLGDVLSIHAPMWIAAGAGVIIGIVSFFYVETAPRCVAKMKHKPTREDHLLKAFRSKEQPLAVAEK